MIKGRPPRLEQIFQTYNQPLFFVTFGTLYRQPFPSLETAHNAFISHATRAQQFNIAVGRYVLMPDHVHLFVAGGRDFVLSQWIKGLKRTISNASRVCGNPFVWQPGFFDHLLRSEESYAEKWEYTLQNPVRAGLVADAENWPYSGEICVIDRV